MQRLRGYHVRTEQVVVRGRAYGLLVPADSDALLDDRRVADRFQRDEYMPYWATLWPAALLLADAVATWPPPDTQNQPPSVLELGCGVGLVGLVAAVLGYRVTVSDYDQDALAFVRYSAQQNGIPQPTTRFIDWRETYDGLRFDRIVAADVLYEARNLQPVAWFIQQHLTNDGVALLSDPNRSTADPFQDIARACGLSSVVTRVERPGDQAGVPVCGRLYDLRHDECRFQ